jgi:hypothetical protein
MNQRASAASLAALVAVGVTLAPSRRALAQDYEWAAVVQLEGGVEGGGNGFAAGVRQARTTLRLGAELGIPDPPRTFWSAAVVVEIEPHSSVGADLRYARPVGKHVTMFGGAQAVIAPTTLYGIVFGAEGRVPMGGALSLTLGPTFKAFFSGDDLPSGTVIWQGLFHVGIHVNFL